MILLKGLMILGIAKCLGTIGQRWKEGKRACMAGKACMGMDGLCGDREEEKGAYRNG